MTFIPWVRDRGWLFASLVIIACLAGRGYGQTTSEATLPGQAPGADVRLETLEDAWRVALEGDRKLEASQWNLSAATRTWAAARAEQLPSLTLGADYVALSQEPAFKLPPMQGFPSTLPFFEKDSGGVHAMVTQPVYTSGRIASGISEAEAGIAANRAEVDRSRLDVKMGVAEAYVNVLRAKRAVEVADKRLVSLSSHVRVVNELFDKGVAAKTDQLAAQVAGANARQQLMQAENAMEVAKAAYSRALGRPLTDPVRLAELDADREAVDVDELTRKAIELRPEIAQISAQACALRDQAAGVQAKKSPQVSLMGGYLYQQDRYIDPNGVAGVAVLAQWNVIDAGRASNQSAALCQKAEGLIRARMDLESLIALEVRQKWLDLQTALAQIDVARQATQQADENLQFARQRYAQQIGTNTEVLDAESLRAQAYSNFHSSTYEAVLARLRLCRAVGNL